MGVDALIRFKPHDGEDMNLLGFRLARQFGHQSFFEHPCIEIDDDGWWDVKILDRYYGEPYERGDWPHIRAILVWLGANAAAVEYGDDASYKFRSAAEVIIVNDAHWLDEGYPYRWSNWLSVEDSPPLDTYGQPMIVIGGGGVRKIYRSAATGEEVTR